MILVEPYKLKQRSPHTGRHMYIHIYTSVCVCVWNLEGRGKGGGGAGCCGDSHGEPVGMDQKGGS